MAEFLPNNDREKNVMILSVAFSPFNNDLVCFCTNDGRLTLFNVSSQAVVAHYESPPQAPAFTSLAWHPVKSHRVMAGCEDGRVYYFDTSSSIIAVLPNPLPTAPMQPLTASCCLFKSFWRNCPHSTLFLRLQPC